MTMEHSFGEEETRRQQEIDKRRDAEHRAQLRAELHRKLTDRVSKVFGVVLGLAIALLILANLSQIYSVTTQTVSRTITHVQAKADASPLRQNAENYEKELDSIVSR